jgi:hypothetical protein
MTFWGGRPGISRGLTFRAPAENEQGFTSPGSNSPETFAPPRTYGRKHSIPAHFRPVIWVGQGVAWTSLGRPLGATFRALGVGSNAGGRSSRAPGGAGLRPMSRIMAKPPTFGA